MGIEVRGLDFGLGVQGLVFKGLGFKSLGFGVQDRMDLIFFWSLALCPRLLVHQLAIVGSIESRWCSNFRYNMWRLVKANLLL